MTMDVSRRSVLLGATVAAAAVGVETLMPMPAGAATPRRVARADLLNPAFTGGHSPNGWPVNTAPDAGGSVWTRPVPGTGAQAQVAIGAAEAILFHVIRRFHYEIGALGPGDIVGFRKAAGLRGAQLNHASGSAVDILPGHYPVGVRGGFFPHQVAVVRDILAECEGVVSWGGDLATPEEGHFQIDLPPADRRVVRLAAKLREWRTTPGRAPGAARDPQDPGRRAAALRLERRQRR